MSNYIYRHIRLDTDAPFYVGKGKNKRAFSKQGRNAYWHRIVKKSGYRIEIILDDLSEQEAFTKETEFIALYKKCGLCEANWAIGGVRGGPVGVTRSKETRQKMAVSKIGSSNPSFGKAPWNKGKPHNNMPATRRATEVNRIPVVDCKTGQRWACIKDAAKSVGLSKNHVAKMLAGGARNTTNLRREG